VTALEDALPGYDFQVRHSRWIAAEPVAVWRALSTLTLDDLWVTRPLVAIRHLGRTAGNGGRRLFTDGPVRMFVLDPPRYALGGTVDRPWQLRPDRIAVTSLQQFMDFDEPGWVAFLTDFTLEVRGNGVQLTTVTRGRCTDSRARRLFAPYWAFIRVPSGLIRRDILAAVSRAARRVDVSGDSRL